MKNSLAVRPAAVAGMFYAGNAASLRRDVEGLLARVPPSKPPSPVLGLVAPHAGYIYSGFTAAHAYALLRGTAYEMVAVLSPSHRECFAGATVYPGDAYSTPLGTIPINAALREEFLARCGTVSASIAGHRSTPWKCSYPSCRSLSADFPSCRSSLGTKAAQVVLPSARPSETL
jgi:AmmeMemoRadiSam system protein B